MLRRTVGLLFCYAGQKHDGHRVGDGGGKKDHRKCHTGENAIQVAQSGIVEDIQKNTVQCKWKIQNGKLSEGIVPEGLFFEKNRNRAVFLRGPAVRDGQAGHQKETRKEFAGGSTECSDSGRGEACGKTEKPGKVGGAHAHELFHAERQLWIPEGRMPSDKIRRSRIVRGSKRSRVPIKSALKKRKMEAEKESITTMPHPVARQIFARLESFLARYDATKRESTVCMPPAPRESISA